MIPNLKITSNEDDFKRLDNLKNEESTKNEYDLINKDDPKNQGNHHKNYIPLLDSHTAPLHYF